MSEWNNSQGPFGHPLSLCFYHCALYVQHPHCWVLAPLLFLPNRDSASRTATGSCALRARYWFQFQFAFCLEARWRCISRDTWSKQTKQPESHKPLRASSHGEGEKPLGRARLELRSIQRWRQAESGQAAGCPQHGTKSYTHRDTLTWVPQRRTVKGNCLFSPFSKLSLPNWFHLHLGCVGEQHLWNHPRSQRAWEGSVHPVWHAWTAVPMRGPCLLRAQGTLLRDVPGLSKTVFPGAPILTPRSLCTEKCLSSPFLHSALLLCVTGEKLFMTRRWDTWVKESPSNWAGKLRSKGKYCLLQHFLPAACCSCCCEEKCRGSWQPAELREL